MRVNEMEWRNRAREALAREILKCVEKSQTPPDDRLFAVLEAVDRFLEGSVPLWTEPDPDNPIDQVRGALP